MVVPMSAGIRNTQSKMQRKRLSALTTEQLREKLRVLGVSRGAIEDLERSGNAVVVDLIARATEYAKLRPPTGMVDNDRRATRLWQNWTTRGDTPTSCMWIPVPAGMQRYTACYNLLTQFLIRPRDQTSWVFLGDSTMSRMFGRVSVRPELRCSKLTGGQCHLVELLADVAPLLNISRRLPWTPPRLQLEGPGPMKGTLRDFAPFCHDCFACFPSVNRITSAACATEPTYLPVEFSRDVEFPTITTTTNALSGRLETKRYNTTQETVASFLAMAPKDACVVNVGTHDMKIRVRNPAMAVLCSQPYRIIDIYVKTLQLPDA